MHFHLLGLTLGVHHEGPARGTGHDDTILSAKVVRGQAADVPLSDLGGLGHESGEAQVLADGNARVQHALQASHSSM